MLQLIHFVSHSNNHFNYSMRNRNCGINVVIAVFKFNIYKLICFGFCNLQIWIDVKYFYNVQDAFLEILQFQIL